jgi:hypothetical protein
MEQGTLVAFSKILYAVFLNAPWSYPRASRIRKWHPFVILHQPLIRLVPITSGVRFLTY